MGSKFLEGSEVDGLSDGSAAIYVANEAIESLTPFFALKTDGNKTLISSLLNTSDVSGLPYDLVQKTEVSWITQGTPAPPIAGELKMYQRDDVMYIQDSGGNETDTRIWWWWGPEQTHRGFGAVLSNTVASRPHCMLASSSD